MATAKGLIFLFAILVPSTIILAQESTEPSTGSPHDEAAPALAASSASGIFDSFPFKPPSFNFSALWASEFSAGGSSEVHIRRKRNVIQCNFAKHGFAKCLGCKKVRRCYPWNFGTITYCGGILPYCNNGFCSTIKGSLCTSSNSTTSNNSTSSNSTSG